MGTRHRVGVLLTLDVTAPDILTAGGEAMRAIHHRFNQGGWTLNNDARLVAIQGENVPSPVPAEAQQTMSGQPIENVWQPNTLSWEQSGETMEAIAEAAFENAEGYFGGKGREFEVEFVGPARPTNDAGFPGSSSGKVARWRVRCEARLVESARTEPAYGAQVLPDVEGIENERT